MCMVMASQKTTRVTTNASEVREVPGDTVHGECALCIILLALKILFIQTTTIHYASIFDP